MFTTILLLLIGCAPSLQEKCVEAYTSLAECAPDLAPHGGSPEVIQDICSVYDLSSCDTDQPTFDAQKCEEAWAATEIAEEEDYWSIDPCDSLRERGKI